MTDNKIFKPISKKIFVGKDKSKEEWTPYYTMHCYPSDNTRDNELHIWDDDFLFVQLAYGTAIDKQGFDPYEYHSFTKTEWLHMLKEARKLTEFKTFEDMYNYVLKASVGMDFNLKHTLNNNQKYVWDMRQETQVILNDLLRWTEFIMKDGDQIEIYDL